MMNRNFLSAAMAILLVACQPEDKGGSTVELRIEGAGETMAYLDRNENNRMYRVDSVKLGSDGSGRMSLPPLPLDFYMISVGEEKVVVALDSTEDLTLHAKAGSLDVPEKVEGSRHSQRLHQWFTEQREFEQERNELREQLAQDPTAMDRFNALNARFYDRTSEFIKEDLKTPAALSAIGRLDFEREFDLYLLVRDELRKVMSRSSYFNQFRQSVDQYEQQMLAIRMQEEEMKRLSSILPVGQEAPEIRQNTPDGGTYALSQMRGKIVLIDFWASWCRPCRIENPNVKRIYDKYKNKGFDILGVSLDRSHDAWVQAIQQDGLPWKHVSDLGFWQNAAAQEYGVQSIPYTVLVDREGKIIEKNLRSHDLEARLAQIFGS